jgi:hypothetical protein
MPELQNPNPTSTNSKSVSVEIKQGAYALGIASFILGIIACVFYWTPFLKPFFAWIALVGLALAVVGLILARVNNRKGFVFPIIGLVICLLPLTIDVTVIGGSAAMKRLANWREQQEAQRQLAAATKAQAEAHWRALPNLAKAQVEAYQSVLRFVATAEFQVKMCQTNVDSAQQQFNQARTNYDRFVATNPLLTNAVYVKIKKDLSACERSIALQQQAIPSLEAAVERTSHPGTPTFVRDEGWFNDNGRRRQRYHWNQPDEGARIALNKACRGYLANARNELANAYAQIPLNQQKLEQIEGDVVAFQENKLHDAESALYAANARLTAVRQSLDESKEQAASSLAAAKSALEEYRSATFPSSK